MSTLTCVLHLGSSHLRAAVAWRDELGHCQAVVVERIEARGCVRRGCVASADDAAARIKQLMMKLHNRLHRAAQTEASAELRQVLQQAAFDKVYVGLGGISLRTLLHEPAAQLPDGTTVTAEVLDRLRDESLHTPLDGYDVLDAVPAGYVLDGTPTPDPTGLAGRELVARHRLVFAERRLRQGMTAAVERAGFKVAGYIVEPLALADVLTPDERRRGCALLNVGADTTTLSVYAGGFLRHVVVIPLGGDTVTQDIMTKGFPHSQAELMKMQWGNASGEADTETGQDSALLHTMRRLPLGELNSVMTCRYEEILANVTRQLELADCEPHKLQAGCFLTGGGALQKGLPTLVSQRVGIPQVSTRCFTEFGLEESERKPDYAGLFAMLKQASEDCRRIVAQPHPPVTAPPAAPTEAAPQSSVLRAAETPAPPPAAEPPRKPETARKPDAPRGEKSGRKTGSRIGTFFGDLFSSQDNE